ncbi:MAG: LysM peptidoglycan-binding domain-containing protein [Chloroflexota bacterium]
MCGHDLRIRPKRKQRVSWLDALLVLAVIGVLGFWWQAGARPAQEVSVEPAQPVLPENIPVLDPTSTTTATPVPTATPTLTPPKEIMLTHEVRQGENLLAISGFYGVTVQQIQQANDLSDELIRVGDILKIPVLRESDIGAEIETSVDSNFTYAVRDGDTVISIADQFGSTVNDILGANNLGANAIIRPGDRLIIPVRNVPDDVLQVSAGQDPDNIEVDGPDSGSEDSGSGTRIYIQPRLLGPPDQATLSRSESILLRWASVDILEPNEWYVIQINPSAGSAQLFFPIWTKTNSHRLFPEQAPPEGSSAAYSWQISVIQVSRRADGSLELIATSPPSGTRSFTWQ